MPTRSLTERIEILEQTVEALQTLPDRMNSLESQILQLRGEMRDGFSAIGLRLDQHDEKLDRLDHRMARSDEQLEQIDGRFQEIDGRFQQIDRRFVQIDERFDETHRYMRLLHEEVISRIALISEGRGRRKR